MGRLPGRCWTLGAAAALAALLLTGCLSTNPAGLHAPKDTPPTPKPTLLTPPYTPPTTMHTHTPPAPKLAPPKPQTGQAPSYFGYFLGKGDTLYSLARRYHVTVEQLKEDNHITSPTDLAIGKMLRIRRVAGAQTPPRPTAPAPPAPSPTPPMPETGHKLSYFVYNVRKGETLYSLAHRFHVTVQELKEDNHITTPTDLPVGKPLLIRHVPGAEQPPGPSSEAGPAPVVGPRRAVAEALLNRGKPGSQFWWPTGGTLARRFGQEVRGFSDPSIAIRAAAGTEVYAVADGKVVSVVLGGDNAQSVWGNVVSIEHAGDMTSWYAHLARVLVKEGERVRKGEAIGTVGRTGQAPEPMLAFRLYHDNRPVDPLNYLP